MQVGLQLSISIAKMMSWGCMVNKNDAICRLHKLRQLSLTDKKYYWHRES